MFLTKFSNITIIDSQDKLYIINQTIQSKTSKMIYPGLNLNIPKLVMNHSAPSVSTLIKVGFSNVYCGCNCVLWMCDNDSISWDDHFCHGYLC